MRACTLAGLLAAGDLLGRRDRGRRRSPSRPRRRAACRWRTTVIVRATVAPRAHRRLPGLSPRLYFRWRDHEDFYWVSLEAEPGGRFWAVPPKPERRNEQIEVLRRPGRSRGQGGRPLRDPDRPGHPGLQGCSSAPRQRGVAQNLTVGETSPQQQGKKVLGFLCDGVVTRVNSAGVRRSDEVCRACVIAWWQRKAVLIPAIAGVSGRHHRPGPEPSPSRPIPRPEPVPRRAPLTRSVTFWAPRDTLDRRALSCARRAGRRHS